MSRDGSTDGEDLSPLDAEILRNYPKLKEDLGTFHSLTKEQKLFAYFWLRKKETTHVEFKASTKTVNPLIPACSMYNGINPDEREPSLVDRGKRSSYIVYGIDEKAGYALKPLQNIEDDEAMQRKFRNNTEPQMTVRWHQVVFDAEVKFQACKSTIKPGTYALLEVPGGNEGPIRFNLSKQKQHLLYSRSGTRNCPEDEWDDSFRKEVFAQFQMDYDPHGLDNLKDDLKHKDDWFKILILPQRLDITKDQKEKLIASLAHEKWQLIIDFDRKASETDSHYKLLDGAMRSRHLAIKNWNEEIKPEEISDCSSGKLTLYTLALGCEELNFRSPKDFNALKQFFSSAILIKLFNNNLSPALCLSLVCHSDLSNPALWPVKLICKIAGVFSAAVENSTLNYLTVFTDSKVKELSLKEISDSGITEEYPCEFKHYLVPSDHLASTFEQLYCPGTTQYDYVFPGVSGGDVTITREEFLEYKSQFSVFHKKSGESKNASVSDMDLEKHALKLCEEFLKGNDLNKEMLFTHEKGSSTNGPRVYLCRDAAKKLKISVLDSLKYCEKKVFHNWSLNNPKNLIHFRCEPLSGSTTIVRSILWDLREEYPCLELKQNVDENVSITKASDGIRKIYDLTKKPVLVLCDSTKTIMQDILTDVSKSKKAIKCVGLIVEKTNDKSKVDLSIKLNEKEKVGLKAIYNSVVEHKKMTEKDMDTEMTLFLFGFWHFTEDYVKTERFVQQIIAELINNDKAKTLLLFIALVEHFTEKPIDLSIAASILELPTTFTVTCSDECPKKCKNPRTCWRYLSPIKIGMARHMLKIAKGQISLFMRKHLAKLILDKLFKFEYSCSRQHYDKNFMLYRIEVIGKILCELDIKAQSKQHERLNSIVKDLLSKTTDNANFTVFEETIRQCCELGVAPTNRIERVLGELADSFTESRPHIFIHYARLAAYKWYDYEKSLRYVRKALELKENDRYFSDTRCNDPYILGMSAHLINCRIEFKSRPGSENEAIYRLPYEDLAILVSESLKLCQRAKKIEAEKPAGRNAHPYVFEINGKRILLTSYFSTICNERSETFIEKIAGDDDPQAKSAFQTILNNIIEVEGLYEAEIIQGNTLPQGNWVKLDRTKKAFVSWCGIHSKVNLLQPAAESKTAIAWIIVDYLLSEEKNDRSPSNIWDRTWKLRLVPTHYQEAALKAILDCGTRMQKNYLEACVLLLLIQPRNALKIGIDIAEEWCNKFSNDYYAHFVCGAFYMAEAFSSDDKANREAKLDRAKAALTKCSQLAQDPRDPDKWKKVNAPRMRFFLRITAQRGISLLGHIEKQQSYENQLEAIRKGNCYRFTGILSQDRSVQCSELPNWRLKVPKDVVSHEELQRKRTIVFAVALSLSRTTVVRLPEN